MDPQPPAKTRKASDSDDSSVLEFKGLQIEDLLRGYGDLSRSAEDSPRPAEVVLAVDLNSGYPTAGFQAPSLGYPEITTLPAFERLLDMKEAQARDTKQFYSKSQVRYFDPDGPKSRQLDHHWKRNLLRHCLRLLQEKIGARLDNARLQVYITARSDVSDYDVATLLKTAKAAGFNTTNGQAVQVVPTPEAVAMAAVKHYLTLSDSSPPKLKYGNNILIVHFDGDLMDIQSYSVSPGSTETGFRMEGLAAGQTVDCGEMVDEQFTRWLRETFGSSFLQLSPIYTSPESQLMVDFAKTRRRYQPKAQPIYFFSLVLENPPPGSPYDPSRHDCQVQDSQMKEFFDSATKKIWESLDDHRTEVGESKNIDKIVFAGKKGVSSYVEDQVRDWGESAGILSAQSGVDVSYTADTEPVDTEPTGYLNFEETPDGVLDATVCFNDADRRLIDCSQAAYGLRIDTPFEPEDPEWSRSEDKFEDRMMCSTSVVWKIERGLLLDSVHREVKGWVVVEEDTTTTTLTLEVVRCPLKKAPRWACREEHTPDPNVSKVLQVNIKFTERDFRDGKRKTCADQVVRRKLHFIAKMKWTGRTKMLRVSTYSGDGMRLLGETTKSYFQAKGPSRF